MRWICAIFLLQVAWFERFLVFLQSNLLGKEPQFIGTTSNYDKRLARYNDGWQLIPRLGAWALAIFSSIGLRAS